MGGAFGLSFGVFKVKMKHDSSTGPNGFRMASSASREERSGRFVRVYLIRTGASCGSNEAGHSSVQSLKNIVAAHES